MVISEYLFGYRVDRFRKALLRGLSTTSSSCSTPGPNQIATIVATTASQSMNAIEKAGQDIFEYLFGGYRVECFRKALLHGVSMTSSSSTPGPNSRVPPLLQRQLLLSR
jgi:hypothetical protein